MVQTWGEKSSLKHDIPSPCDVSHHPEAFWITEQPALPCKFILCLSILFAITVFHFWQQLCQVPIFPFHMQLLLASILSVSSWFSTISFPLFSCWPALITGGSHLPSSHLHAQWSDFFVQFFSVYLWPSSSTFLFFHIMAGSAFLLSSLKLSHLSHSFSPNPFLHTDFQIYFPFTISCFHLNALLPGLLINIFLHFDINIHIQQSLPWCWSTPRKHRREHSLPFIFSSV